LPAFTQVELTLDPQPGPRTLWVGFDEYRKDREAQSRPPALLVPDFFAWLERLKSESGFESWVFRPGMFFGDCVEWWGDRNRRRTPHEGIDFAEGRLADGSIRSVPEGTPVRAISDGVLAEILDDFLGKTVVLRHPDVRREDGSVFHSLYSHIHPESSLSGAVGKGRLLGKVLKSTGAGAPAHLHLTAAWIPESVSAEGISLEHVSSSFAPVVLINLNGLLVGRVRQAG
jgi:murein DD-endopeptidase MepM/ murein hydrolase activator NlpD